MCQTEVSPERLASALIDLESILREVSSGSKPSGGSANSSAVWNSATRRLVISSVLLGSSFSSTLLGVVPYPYYGSVCAARTRVHCPRGGRDVSRPQDKFSKL